jgi:hypothetical protein
MTKKLILALLISCGVAGSLYAQVAEKSCGTDQVYWEQLKLHPEIAIIDQQLEHEIQEKLKNIDLKAFAKGTATVYDVPVVVHVIHDYGTENLSDDAIYAAVQKWTATYMCLSPDTADVIPEFKSIIGNAQIRFHLATKDPNGNPTKGITRHWSYESAQGGEDAKLDDWPRANYINIWFVRTFDASHSGAAAYSNYPAAVAGNPYSDGVISLYDYMDNDNTIPHEIGHMLNLQHVWGNNNNAGVQCGDDQVADTPPTKGHNGGGCSPAALFDTACNNGQYVNSQNIMDYTFCSKMFTIGQVSRMRAALTSGTAQRSNLFTASNLAATGALDPVPDLAPTPEFSVERGSKTGIPPAERSFFLCANDATTKFVFKNQSWNDTVTNVDWTFSNGATTPTSTSTTTVINEFTQPGWVSVTIKATGNNSGSNTVTVDNAVYAADNNSVSGLGYHNDFATAGDMDKWPLFNYYRNTFKWQWFGTTGYNDGACIKYRAYDDRTGAEAASGSATGDFDDIYTPAFDLTAVPTETLNLNFFTSGAFRSGNSPKDSLEIFASNTCGAYWTKIGSISGSNLLNKGKIISEYTPTSASDWIPQTISVPTTFRGNRVFFRFRYNPYSNGNTCYFDNFGISQFPTEIKEAMATPSAIAIYPNPSKGDCNMLFTAGNDGKVVYDIKDLTGKVIYANSGNYTPNSLCTQNISGSVFPASGLYFVTVTIANKTVTQKLLIERN